MSWKQLFGEPVVLLSALVAGLQVVDWTVIGATWVRIVVSAIVAILGVLIARSKVTPVEGDGLPARLPDDADLIAPDDDPEARVKPDGPR